MYNNKNLHSENVNKYNSCLKNFSLDVHQLFYLLWSYFSNNKIRKKLSKLNSKKNIRISNFIVTVSIYEKFFYTNNVWYTSSFFSMIQSILVEYYRRQPLCAIAAKRLIENLTLTFSHRAILTSQLPQPSSETIYFHPLSNERNYK